MNGANLQYQIFYPKDQNQVISTLKQTKNVMLDKENPHIKRNRRPIGKTLFHA